MAALFCLSASAQGYERYYADLPIGLAMPEMPRIAGGEVILTDFGATGDGVALCTAAFEAAMDALAAAGGGRLVVPSGVWLTGPIVLRSGIDLHLERGAILLLTPDKRQHFRSGDYSGRADPGI